MSRVSVHWASCLPAVCSSAVSSLLLVKKIEGRKKEKVLSFLRILCLRIEATGTEILLCIYRRIQRQETFPPQQTTNILQSGSERRKWFCESSGTSMTGKVFVVPFLKLTSGEFWLVACSRGKREMLMGNSHHLKSNPRKSSATKHQLFCCRHRGLAPGRQDKSRCKEITGNLCRHSKSPVTGTLSFSQGLCL